MAQRQWRSDDTDKWKYGFGDGSDGDLVINSNTTYEAINASCSGDIDSYTLNITENIAFSPGQLVLIHKSRGNTNAPCGSWELNKIDNYQNNTITLKHKLCHTYTTSGNDCSQIIVLKQYRSVTIDNNASLTVKPWNNGKGGVLAFLSQTNTNINGKIQANGGNGAEFNHTSGNTYGGGFWGGRATKSENNLGTGEGTLGAPQNNQPWNQAYEYGSAGTIGAGSGVGGGNATGGDRPTQTGMFFGAQSLPSGNSELTQITFGGGGGGGGGEKGHSIGSGGSGGGIVMIFTNQIVVNGEINLRGGNGGNGFTDNWADKPMGAGGGGAGGSLLLKCKRANLGDSIILANGGNPGTNINRTGGAGSPGRIHLDYSLSVSGTTTPAANLRQDATITDKLASSALMFKKMLMATM